MRVSRSWLAGACFTLAAAVLIATVGAAPARAPTSRPSCISLDLSPGAVKRDLDGDTFALYAVRIPPEEIVRVLGVDTPERGQTGFAEAAAFTTTWLGAGPFTLASCKRDSFGRMLATVSRAGRTLADTLIILHLGVPR